MNNLVEAGKETNIRTYREAPSLQENPFLDNLVVKTKKKRITVARGSDIVDGTTGEITGRTEIGQIIEVGGEEFIQLFTKDIGIWFDFERSTQKLFAQILQRIQSEAINRDKFYYCIEDMEKDVSLSRTTVYKALTELINKGVIAKHKHTNWFFLNPALLFNGDRADFVKSYRVSKKSPELSHKTSNYMQLK